MATTINLSLQSQVQENNRHVVQQTRSLLTTFSKLPWKASKLRHPSECYQYATRQSNNALLPLTVAHHQPHSQSLTCTSVAADRISLISQPAQLQPRPPIRRYNAMSQRKCVLSKEPYLYPDPLGDAKTDHSEFYHRVSELSRLEEETVKWEELQSKGHCRPSYSSSRLSRRPSSEKQLVMVRPSVKDDETTQSIPALVITQSPSMLQSPTHYSNSQDVHTENHSSDAQVVTTVTSPTHSESNDSQPTISSAPVILTNGKLSNSDCQQARHQLRRSMSQDHVSPRKSSKSHRRLSQRSGSAVLLTASSSSTSVSSTCSERSHMKQNRVSSNKKKHKK